MKLKINENNVNQSGLENNGKYQNELLMASVDSVSSKVNEKDNDQKDSALQCEFCEKIFQNVKI